MGSDPTATNASEGPRGAALALGSWALPLGLLVLLGPVAPLDWGLFWPLLALIGLTGLAAARGRLVQRWVHHCGGWSAAFAELDPMRRSVLLAMVALPAITLLTVAARAVASIVVAQPASVWALLVVALGAPLVALARGRARLPLVLVVATLIPISGVAGARYEAAAEDARGWAHSGPIHGIHPFQTTAIIIDGHGPFDLPFNDYVEPDGSRGYGPEAFADALERALHDIARVHYGEGPHRARLAFADARVEARVDPAIRERLDQEPGEAEHPRVFVQSGTWGQRSRVEFVCPGRRDEPSGISPDNVMNRMCPDKYASEASAGLGLTGRWPGYAEGRGNERFGMSRAFGWTRSDDAQGRRAVEREIRGWAWIVLLAVGVWTLIGGSGGRAQSGDRPGAGMAVSTIAAAVALLGVLVLLGLALGAGPPHVRPFERPPPWIDPWSLRSWLAVLMLGGALFWFDGTQRPGRAHLGARRGVGVAAIALGVCIVVVAGHLEAIAWIEPRLWPSDGGQILPFERWALQVAEAVGPRAGIGILEVEGAVAAALVGVLLGVCATLGGALRDAAAWIAPPTTTRRARSWAVALALLAAAALVMSRKTEGASTLLPGAITLSVLLGSSVAMLARAPQEASAGRAGLALLGHLVWTTVAVLGVLASAAAAPVLHPFVIACAGLGLLVAVGGLLFVSWPSGQRAAPAGGTGRDA